MDLIKIHATRRHEFGNAALVEHFPSGGWFYVSHNRAAKETMIFPASVEIYKLTGIIADWSMASGRSLYKTADGVETVLKNLNDGTLKFMEEA
jgi:hypothetical protein